MSSGSDAPSLFDSKGNLKYVKPGGGGRKKRNLARIVLVLAIAVAVGYGLNTPRGDDLLDQGWKWLTRPAVK